MAIEVQVLEAARSDLREHARYLGRTGADRDTRFLLAVRKTFDFLAENPGAGALYQLDDPTLPALRKWAIRGYPQYLIFYRDEGDKIEIVRILHGSRDLPAHLRAN